MHCFWDIKFQHLEHSKHLKTSEWFLLDGLHVSQLGALMNGESVVISDHNDSGCCTDLKAFHHLAVRILFLVVRAVWQWLSVRFDIASHTLTLAPSITIC